MKVVGLWIALEDCTLENGCLSFAPGSHKGNKVNLKRNNQNSLNICILTGELKTKFIRNPNKEEFEAGKYLIYTNPNPDFSQVNFIPAPVKAGILKF